ILINLLRKEKQRTQGSASAPPWPAAALPPTLHEQDGVEPGAGAALSAPPPSPALPATDYECVIGRFIGQNFTLAEREAFKIFAADRKNRIEVEMTKEALRAKFEEAKLAAARIKLTRKRMVSLHNEMKLLSDLDPAERVKKTALQDALGNEQASYRKTLMDLQLLKVETGHQKHAVEQAKLRLLRKFQDWWAAQISCCSGLTAPAAAPEQDNNIGSSAADQEGGSAAPTPAPALVPASTPGPTPGPIPAPRPQSCQSARPPLQAFQSHPRPWSAGQALSGASSAPCHTGSMPCFCLDPCRPTSPGPGADEEEPPPPPPPVTTIWARIKLADQGQGQEKDRGQDQEQPQPEESGPGPDPQSHGSEGKVVQTCSWRKGSQQTQTAPDDEEYIINNIALTGEPDVDREIIEFYKARNRMSRGHTT
ncbi:Kinesin-like protein KIF6, partial [Frankliniella fusca]